MSFLKKNVSCCQPSYNVTCSRHMWPSGQNVLEVSKTRHFFLIWTIWYIESLNFESNFSFSWWNFKISKFLMNGVEVGVLCRSCQRCRSWQGVELGLVSKLLPVRSCTRVEVVTSVEVGLVSKLTFWWEVGHTPFSERPDEVAYYVYVNKSDQTRVLVSIFLE